MLIKHNFYNAKLMPVEQQLKFHFSREFGCFNVHLTINQWLSSELHHKFNTIKCSYR